MARPQPWKRKASREGERMGDLWQRLFSAEGKARRQAERNYAACLRERDSILLGFRRQAVEEITTLYGPCLVLMNRRHTAFLALAENGEYIVDGEFGDDYVPTLEFVDTLSPEVTTRDISGAANAFRNKVHWNKTIVNPSILSDRFKPEYEKAIRTVGYWIKPYQTKMVRDLRIELNQKPLSATHAEASKALFDAVLRTPPLGRDTLSTLEVTVGVENSENGQLRGLSYRLSYFDGSALSGESRREQLLGVIRQVAPFVTRLTSLMGAGMLDVSTYEIKNLGDENDDIPID
jgi:hypothetical protein